MTWSALKLYWCRASCLCAVSKRVTQELASRGLSLAYRLGTPETQKVLLDALVGSLQGAPRHEVARLKTQTGA